MTRVMDNDDHIGPFNVGNPGGCCAARDVHAAPMGACCGRRAGACAHCLLPLERALNPHRCC